MERIGRKLLPGRCILFGKAHCMARRFVWRLRANGFAGKKMGGCRAGARGLLLALLFLLLPLCARAETAEELIDGLELSAWQEAADQTGWQLNVREMILSLAQGRLDLSPERMSELLGELILGEAQGMKGMLLSFMGPALLWGISRQLSGRDRPGGAAGWVCYVFGASVMLNAFVSQMELARQTIRQMGRLTGQVFPVLTALMSSTGRAGTAGLLQPLAAFGGGAMTGVVERIAVTLCGGMATLAVAGNLSERMRLDSLFSLCRSVGKWVLGAVMTVFLGMTAMCGVIGPAQDSVTLRAAKYAADSLLPVVGGDIADAMEAMAASASAVRGAAGLTGVAVMLAVCLRPVVRLTMGLITCLLAEALTEPVADGPLKACAGQMGKTIELLLAAVAVSAALFIMLTGVCIGRG